MIAIFKREFKSYFATPIGYIVIAALYFFLGLFFAIIYSAGAPITEYVIISMSTIIIFLMPVLTMRLMSEDRRQKVDQVLFTSPVSLYSVVLGKFFAALAVLAIGFAPTVIFEIIMASSATVNLMSFIYALLGILLLGAALIALGMFISCLTESTVISAILSLVINIVLIFMSSITSSITIPTGEGFFSTLWSKTVEYFVLVLDKLSFINAFNNFGESIFSIADIIYFLSIIAVFLFLCVRSLEKRRWS